MTPQELITSDLLEQLALGQLSPAEALRVEGLAHADPQAAAILNELRSAIERLAQGAALSPGAGVKDKVLGAINAALEKDAREGHPPVLHPASKLAEFTRWINDPALVRPADAGPFFIIPIYQEGSSGTALLWLTLGAPEETHTNEIEKFLIVEGTCEISLPDRSHHLKAGDYLSIPLHTPHTIKVTSDVPCKLVLQRLAA
ncbi:MAG: cupin domain-containing protein [Flavobacteriales bacterium]|nr:cupin domain-containing protein [Flavobacteriales bacterium]